MSSILNRTAVLGLSLAAAGFIGYDVATSLDAPIPLALVAGVAVFFAAREVLDQLFGGRTGTPAHADAHTGSEPEATGSPPTASGREKVGAGPRGYH